MKDFLHNEYYAVMVAKIAIIFQSVITFLICGILLLILYTKVDISYLILPLLYLDILFIILHMTYRKLYKGKKIALEKQHVRILTTHILSSILAIGLTFFLVYNVSYISNNLFVGAIFISWALSLFSGSIFYTKKYKKGLLE